MLKPLSFAATALAVAFIAIQPVTASAGSPNLTAQGVYKQSTIKPINLNCASAKRLVRKAGFKKIRTVECEGCVYTYRAVKNGQERTVRVDSHTGRVFCGHRHWSCN